MIFRNDIAFLHPEFFLLLFLLPVAGYFYMRRRSRYYPTLRMSSLASVAQLQSWRGQLRALLPVFRLLAIVALITAMARPQQVSSEQEVEAEGIDIMLALDLSSSMLAQDFKPNRLEVSKKVASTFIDKREYDRIGLTVFADEAVTWCALTIDHEQLKNDLFAIETGILEDGTAIGMGLATAVRHLENSEAESKIVILLTDGVNNSGYIDPEMAAQIAKERNITVYTIGVGTTGEALTPINRQRNGRYIFGKARVEIDEELLREIAQLTGGAYYRATSEESLQRIYDEIDQLEKTKIDVTVTKQYAEAFHPFVFWGMILLLLEALLRYTVLRTIP
mgnify:CR=1 FL=1